MKNNLLWQRTFPQFRGIATMVFFCETSRDFPQEAMNQKVLYYFFCSWSLPGHHGLQHTLHIVSSYDTELWLARSYCHCIICAQSLVTSLRFWDLEMSCFVPKAPPKAILWFQYFHLLLLFCFEISKVMSNQRTNIMTQRN